MLVAIDGVVIDTAQIYAIDPISENNIGFIGFEFVVHFLNKKSKIVEIKAGLYVNGHATRYYESDTKQYPNWIDGDYTHSILYVDSKSRLTLARNILITYWNSSKSTIPQINI